MAAPQMQTPYGLLGRKLGHSWSRPIHEQLGSAPYSHLELEPADVTPFIRENTDWRGLNVTIPYKADAAAAADEQSPRVAALGVANTLVRREDGTIFAENTDVLGFSWMLGRFCEQALGCDAASALAGKKALALGSGGASQAIQASLCEAGADVVVVSRSGEDNYGNLLERHADAALIVNTTPVGMFPNCPASPLPDGALEAMGGLVGVLDVVYNPCRTKICLDAERAGIAYETGLPMLVAQAFFASELFQGKALDEGLCESILASIRRKTESIVLIGMPGAGKTSAGKRLARALGRPFVDIDEAIAQREGRSAAQIIESEGEDAFRAIETQVTGDVAAKPGLIIACGGGVVTRPENRDLLRQNGHVVMLDRKLDELSSKGRPMSRAKGVEQLAHERMGAYRSWADLIVKCTGTADGDAALITQKLGF
ncbi:shikimate kinase [Paratractidigestivibacter sp.]|uniref:shikimate kinase n=1 Tax=Paratractidigestivibacter sp. TaxID=2847316 RepID=UPI002ABDD6FE|nr:shikimate kinase [Paratractidigestivibacter sp.]